jgi:diacylglycerol kinase (ATP)
VSQANTNEDNTEIYVMNNYFGIGIDAEISLGFHHAREENPNKFRSRIHNKTKYFQLGIRRMMNSMHRDFHKNVTLEVDGRRVEIAPQIEGIVILNILRWVTGGIKARGLWLGLRFFGCIWVRDFGSGS